MNIEELCVSKERELLAKYFGGIDREAAVEQPESIGLFTMELPEEIEAEYRAYLEELWRQFAPDNHKEKPMVLEEKKLRELLTENDREALAIAHKAAETRTLWERITRTNHTDVAHYKSLLRDYTRDVLTIMRLDFLEELTGRHIGNKTFNDD